MTAGDVFNDSAALLNDQIKSVFTDAVQLPYLNMALQDLSEKLELNNVAVTNATSANILVPANVDTITLPAGVVEIQQIWQRTAGTTVPYIPIARYEFLPHYWEDLRTSIITAWAWMGETVKFIPANTDADVKLDFIKNILPPATSASSPINVINSKNFLAFKTAALCAQFIGENEERAAVLNAQSELSFSQMLGVNTKGRQATVTRRRPFMARFKSRSVW